ncbi:TonB-dependent receptor [bacterium]|nr:TonB-dependent receptor [bacterium]
MILAYFGVFRRRFLYRARAASWFAAVAFLFVQAPQVFAAGAVTGAVFDDETLIPLAGAEVSLEGTDFSQTTDDEGAFTFKDVPDGEYVVAVEALGFERRTAPVTVAGGEAKIEMLLSPSAEGARLAEVTVSARRETVDVAKQTLSGEEIRTVPGAAGDAIRVVQSLPGTANLGPSAFGQNGLVIRGSSPEDSRYFVDGFDIPQLFHFGGLLTVVNSEWLSSLDYYAGGYAVRYGEAMGGIVDLRSRPPVHDDFSGVIDVTNYASFALIESPLSKNGEFAGGFAIRRSFIDFILPELIPEDEAQFTVLPRFYDYQAAVEYTPNEQNTLRVFAFGSDDQLGLVQEETDEQRPTATQSFDLNAWFHRPILSWGFTPSSTFDNRLAVAPVWQDVHIAIFDDNFFEISGEDIEIRDDLVWRVAEWNTIGFGLEGALARFNVRADIVRPPKEGNPGGADLFNEQSYLYDEELRFAYGAAYIEDSIDLGGVATVTPGVRASTGGFESDTQSGRLSHVDPRAFARIYATDALTFKGGAGVYHQYPEPDELLDPFGTIDLVSERAVSFSAGAEYVFEDSWFVDVQGYYKKLDRLVARTGADDEEPYDNAGIGRIHGAELLVRKELVDRLYGWLAYTYTVSERRDRPGDDWRYFDQDQRHNVVVLASYKLGETWRAGARFSYATGLPYTEVDNAIYNADTDSYIPIFSEDVNAKRNTELHQLDLRVDKTWPFQAWTLATYLDIHNVYARRQPAGYLYNFDYTEREAVTFPTFYPTLGVQGRW